MIPAGWFLRDGRPCMTWQHAIEIYEQTIRVIGLLCSSHGCTALAAFRCFWPAPSGDHYESKQPQCEYHTAKLDQVATAMGFTLQVQPVRISDECRMWTLAQHRERMRREAAELELKLAGDPTAARFAAMELD